MTVLKLPVSDGWRECQMLAPGRRDGDCAGPLRSNVEQCSSGCCIWTNSKPSGKDTSSLGALFTVTSAWSHMVSLTNVSDRQDSVKRLILLMRFCYWCSRCPQRREDMASCSHIWKPISANRPRTTSRREQKQPTSLGRHKARRSRRWRRRRPSKQRRLLSSPTSTQAHLDHPDNVEPRENPGGTQSWWPTGRPS